MAYIFSRWYVQYVHQVGSDTCDSAHDGCKFMRAYLDLQLRKIDRLTLLCTYHKVVANEDTSESQFGIVICRFVIG
jgi:hypothetical protein